MKGSPVLQDVVIVGGGPAGLSVSHELTGRGIDHIVLERGRVAQTWRERWDSFCLVTPNWTMQLPGGTYEGPDPDGYMPKDAIVEHLERYATSFAAPVREGIAVTSLRPNDDGFRLDTSDGPIDARIVVLAAGAYPEAHRPAAAASLPQDLFTIDAGAYTNATAIPDGGVLVVGAGQTGVQIAEELHDTGRDVVLACGKAPWVPRRIEGRDFVSWALETPFLEQGVDALPSPAARLAANFQATGRRGGYDLHFRTLTARGVTLAGHLAGVEGSMITFEDDLAASVAWGDARFTDLANLLVSSLAARGAAIPAIPEPEPFTYPGPTAIPRDRIRSVVFTSGYRLNYQRWVEIPGAFDEMGFPIQTDGASRVADNLFFAGVHFLRKRKSATLLGMGEDGRIVADGVTRRLAIR